MYTVLDTHPNPKSADLAAREKELRAFACRVGAKVKADFLLFSAMHMSLAAAAIVAAIPLTLTFGYVFGFRQGRPPGYDIDITDYWLNGAGFALNPQRQPQLALDRSQSACA